MSQGHWIGAARYGLPGLAAGLILAWWSGGHGPMAVAKGAPTGGEAGGTVAFTSPLIPTANGSPSQLLYILDTNAKAFAVYRVEPTGSKGSGTVKLEAARQYRWDLQLSEYNNLSPEASAVEEMVKQSKAK